MIEYVSRRKMMSLKPVKKSVYYKREIYDYISAVRKKYGFTFSEAVNWSLRKLIGKIDD